MRLARLVQFCAVVGILGAGLASSQGGYAILLLAALCIACLDVGSLVTVRNITVVYYFLVLGIGPYEVRVSDPARVQRFAVVLFAVFLAASFARRLLSQRRPHTAPASDLPAQDPGWSRRGPLVLLKVAVAVQLILTAVNVAQYGVSAYLSGASLAGKLTSYVATGGLATYQIVALAGQALTASLVAVYVQASEPIRAYHWRWLVLLLVGMPLIGLQRGLFVEQLLVLLLLHRISTSRRVGGGVGRAAVVGLALIVALGAGLGFGVLRAQQLSPGVASASSTQTVLNGELSPDIVINDALAPQAPRFHGAGIWVPLLERYIPRRLAPDKPANTTTRYMQISDPAAFAAGYTLAPTAVGATVLNYGPLGAFALAAVVGFATGRERIPRTGSAGYACLGYFVLYTILRNDPVNSLSFGFVALLGYWIVERVYRHRSVKPGPSRSVVTVTSPGVRP